MEERTIEDYCEGRKNAQVYKTVYESFIPCIASYQVYRTELDKRLVNGENDSELYTHSDEAFTLLLLENNFDRWMDIYQRHDGRPSPDIGSGKKKKFTSDVCPKYTYGGIVYSKEKSVSNSKGWTKEGIERFNELFDRVNQDRKLNPLFVKRWLREKRAEKSNTKTARKKSNQDIVLPRDELDYFAKTNNQSSIVDQSTAGIGEDSDDEEDEDEESDDSEENSENIHV